VRARVYVFWSHDSYVCACKRTVLGYANNADDDNNKITRTWIASIEFRERKIIIITRVFYFIFFFPHYYYVARVQWSSVQTSTME
jgi:hypothetical protein